VRVFRSLAATLLLGLVSLTWPGEASPRSADRIEGISQRGIGARTRQLVDRTLASADSPRIDDLLLDLRVRRDDPGEILDAETLDVLEDILVDYAGTLIMVSHDRAFLDNVVTSTLVFEGDGVVTEHAGGYTDWRNELARIAVAKRTAALGTATKTVAAKSTVSAQPGAKLNNKERKELETLPGKIEQLEAEQAQITVQLGDPEIYKDGGTKAAALQKRLHVAEAEHSEALSRWMDLDARKDA
jgi:ABC-type sulfate/molybdate transport systems ATPase subunit